MILVTSGQDSCNTWTSSWNIRTKPLSAERNFYMEHHDLDPYPIPKDETPLFINEPWLIDKYLFDYSERIKEPEAAEDNVRVYVPLDINREAILRRLRLLISQYQEANEDNEMHFSRDVDMLVSQIEIYDQIWYVRHMPKEGKHSVEAISLVKDFIILLESIPDGCAESFPFETIDELREEYLS